MADDLEFATRITGVDAAVQEIGRVKNANESTARSTQQAARTTQQSVTQIGDSMRQMGQRAGQTVGAVGQFTSTLASLAPVGSQTAQIITQLGGTISALSSSALGPVGIALAAVSTAVGIYRIATQDAERETQAMAASVETLSTSYEELLGHINDVNEARARESRLSMGLGSLEEQQALVERETNYLTNLRSAVQSVRQAIDEEGGATEARLQQLQALDEARSAAERRIASAREAMSLAQQDQNLEQKDFEATGLMPGQLPEAPSRRASGAAQRASAAERQAEAERQRIAREAQAFDDFLYQQDQADFERQMQERRTQWAREEQLEAEKAEQRKELLREAAEAQAELLGDAKTASAEFSASWSEGIDSVIEHWRDANKALRSAGQQMISTSRLLEVGMTSVGHNIADTIGGTMTSAFQSALGAWLDGSKSFVEAAEDMAKGVIKALVMESIVQAITEGARGIADLASYHYDTAALHFAAAAAWAGVGVVAGTVGAAVGAFGGAGAKDTSSSASTQVTPTETQAATPTNTTINVYPGGFTTRREVVAGVAQALNDAGRLGYHVDASVIRG